MIIRRRHTANFTTIGNVLFEDVRLAADEVGILAYLLSQPHDWEVRRPALMRRWRVGRDTVKRIVNNWMSTGWCRAEKIRLPDGTFDIVYEIRDEPGPSLTEEEVKRALSLVSGEVAPENSEETGSEPCTDALPEVEPCAQPHTVQPGVASPLLANPYVVDKNGLNTDSPRKDSNKKPEREDACGHDRKARFIAAFEMRWPTAATDDRARTAKAARDLPDDQEEPALQGIGPFLEKLKHDGRKTVPAGWRYLEQKPWTLLEAPEKQPHAAMTALARGSAEAKAVRVLYLLAGCRSAVDGFMRAADGGIWYRHEIAPRLLALAQAAPEADYVAVDHRQAGAWNDLIDEFVIVQARRRLRGGDRAPWLWPPRIDGTLSSTGPPDTLLTEQDVADLDQIKI